MTQRWTDFTDVTLVSKDTFRSADENEDKKDIELNEIFQVLIKKLW